MEILSPPSPADGATVEPGVVAFTATAEDPEDGPLSGTIDWSAVLVGTGEVASAVDSATFSPELLAEGTYEITATVEDSEAQVAMDTHTLIVSTLIGEGFAVDTEISFTDPIVFGLPLVTTGSFDNTGPFCMKIFSASIDFNNMKKFEFELKLSKEQKLKGSLDNGFDGNFTKCLDAGDLLIFNDGDVPLLKLKLETIAKDKLEFKDIPIVIVGI